VSWTRWLGNLDWNRPVTKGHAIFTMVIGLAMTATQLFIAGRVIFFTSPHPSVSSPWVFRVSTGLLALLGLFILFVGLKQLRRFRPPPPPVQHFGR
jgi:ABC-type nickel/cobalt efflux system permease component RcnA